MQPLEECPIQWARSMPSSRSSRQHWRAWSARVRWVGARARAVPGAVHPDEPEPVEGRLVEHRAEPLAEDAGVDEEDGGRVAWSPFPVLELGVADVDAAVDGCGALVALVVSCPLRCRGPAWGYPCGARA